MDNTRVKNSVGIWAFGPNATRFVPGGYHPEVVHEDMVTRTKRVVDGLADVLDGLEYHYPGEINEETLNAIKAALGPMNIYCLAAGLHTDLPIRLGPLSIPMPRSGAKALTHSREESTLLQRLAPTSLSGRGPRATTIISSETTLSHGIDSSRALAR